MGTIELCAETVCRHVVLFEATGSKEQYGDTRLGWKKLVQGTLSVKLISCSHGFVVKDEQAIQVASLMQEYLYQFEEEHNQNVRKKE